MENAEFKKNDKERYESASLRHQISYHNGEYLDSETNLHHIAHGICGQLFLLEIELREKNSCQNEVIKCQ